MSACCCSLAGTAACQNCKNNPYATGADGVMTIVNHLRTYVEPQTNGDRIRQMSDEELDKFLGGVQWDVANYCGGVTEKQEYPVPEQRGAWIDWLKAPVKEDK